MNMRWRLLIAVGALALGVHAIDAQIGSPSGGFVQAIVGAFVDGWNSTQGTTTQTVCAAYNTSGCTEMQLLRLVAQLLGNPATLTGSTSSGITGTYSEIVPANTTGISIKGSAGTLYGLPSLTNNGTVPLYVKFYNTASAPTCGSGTVIFRFEIPTNASTAAAGAGSNPTFPVAGINFSTGIGMCVTGGFADADTTSPTASIALVNVAYQ